MEANDIDKTGIQNSNRGDKIKEIVAGFFIGIFAYVILGMIAISLNSMTLGWIFGLAFVLSIFLLFIKHRQYIAIGLVLSIVIPLITIGGCAYFIRL